ncbi:hypothetical protein ACKF11_12735 [Methylobacillus sp. Pita2]|uniref:hypothetical protein n=1 Tax=Methylobacillus sp. Pita2 TaxID=3383245 RepID=UPI0038B4B2C4
MRNEAIANLTKLLNGPMKPRVIPTTTLYDLLLKQVKKVDKNKTISLATYFRHLDTLVKIGFLAKLENTRGVYVNLLAVPKVEANEIAEHLVPESVITLHSALHYSGALNNPAKIVTAVIPTKPKGWRGGEKVDGSYKPFGEFWFFRMPEDMVHLPDLDSSDYVIPYLNYQMATPEKALLDWIYMATSPRIKSNEGYPPLDIDLKKLDKHKLARIARSMRLHDEYLDWLNAKRDHDSSPNVMGNMSVALGF